MAEQPARRLEGSRRRLQRARTHLRSLTRKADAYTRSHAKNYDWTFNSATQKVEGLWKKGRRPTHGISILVGEVVYNLRASLDYLVFELALSDSGFEQDFTQFPIDSNSQEFNRHKKTRLRGISDHHVAAIEKLQPFNGCEWTRTLASLSNPDKHRKLTPSQGTTEIHTRLELGEDAFAFVGRPGRVFPRQGRLKGRIWDVYVECDVQTRVMFEDGKRVVETLEELASNVGDTLDDFESEIIPIGQQPKSGKTSVDLLVPHHVLSQGIGVEGGWFEKGKPPRRFGIQPRRVKREES